MVTTADGSVQWRGRAQVPGPSASQDSYRAEVYGIMCIITSIERLCEEYDIPNGRVEIGCDGKDAVYRSVDQNHVPSPNDAAFDVISGIKRKIRVGRCSYRYRHVKGHQDAVPGARLDLWAHLNIAMDESAKEYWWVTRTGPSPGDRVDAEVWPIWVNGTKVTGYIDATIWREIHLSEAESYWQRKRKLDKEGWRLIHQEIVSQARKSLSIPRRIWLAKHSSGFEATAKTMAQRRAWPSAICVRCNAAVETSNHVLQCGNDEA